jgi:hypothetical protein
MVQDDPNDIGINPQTDNGPPVAPPMAPAVQLPDQNISAPLPPPNPQLAAWQQTQNGNPNVSPDQVAANLAAPQTPPSPRAYDASDPSTWSGSPISPLKGPESDLPILGGIVKSKIDEAAAAANGDINLAAQHNAAADASHQRLSDAGAGVKSVMQDLDRREKDYDARRAVVEQMQVNPQNYWNKAGTASNIMSAIAVGLGSFASGMTKGATGNPGLTLLTQAINNDMESQKTNIDSAWKGLTARGTVMDNVLHKGIFQQNALLALDVAGWKEAEARVKAIEATTNSVVVKEQAKQFAGQIALQLNVKRQALGASIASAAAAQTAATKVEEKEQGKEILDYMKDHKLDPNNPESVRTAATAVFSSNSGRGMRVAKAGGGPPSIRGDIGADKFNTASDIFIQQQKDLYKKQGLVWTDEDETANRTAFAEKFSKDPTVGLAKTNGYTFDDSGKLIRVKPESDSGNYVSPDAVEKGRVTQMPMVDKDGVPILGPNGQPKMQDYETVTPEAAKDIETFRRPAQKAAEAIKVLEDPKATEASKIVQLDTLKQLRAELTTTSSRPGTVGIPGGLVAKVLNALGTEADLGTLRQDPSILQTIKKGLNNEWTNLVNNGVKGGYKGKIPAIIPDAPPALTNVPVLPEGQNKRPYGGKNQ